MPIPITQCALCHHQQSVLLDQRSFRGTDILNHVCSGCGMVYQSPQLSETEQKAFYEEEYRQVYQGSAGPNAKDLSIQKARADSLLEFMRSNGIKPRRHLDIGCSAGLLLQKFQEAFQDQPTGIEPGNAYREHARSLGLGIFQSLEELNASQPEQFDFISMAHVLEHIPQPVEYLKDLKDQWLSADGWLLIEVPNLYGHDCFEIAHSISYSPHTLDQVLQQAGYETVVSQVHGKPRSLILPLYLTILARPSQTNPSHPPVPEKRVRWKRKTAMLKRRVLTRLYPRKAWLPVSQ